MGGRENRPSIVGMDITLIYSGIRALFGPPPIFLPQRVVFWNRYARKLLLQTFLENENFKILERPLALIIMLYTTE